MVDSNKSMVFGKPSKKEQNEDIIIRTLYREIEKQQYNVCYVCHEPIGDKSLKADSCFDMLTGEKLPMVPPFPVPTERVQLRHRHLYHRPVEVSRRSNAYAMSEREAEKLHNWSISFNRFL